MQRLDHVTREGALGLLGARSPASLDLFAVCVVELNDGVVSAVSVLLHLGVQLELVEFFDRRGSLVKEREI